MGECDFSDARIAEGIRLFNEGLFFECHDVWEDFWSEQTCAERPFFQGLIQAAVALFHFEEGNLGGARRMYLSSRANLSGFPAEVGGVDLAGLLEQMDACFAELCGPHSSYPFHVRLDAAKRPRIVRVWESF
jgi:predicted metal-dependent hydrolase